MNRLRAFFQRLDRWIADTLAGAIEADLRDAGYIVRRADDGAIIWAEPTAVAHPPAEARSAAP